MNADDFLKLYEADLARIALEKQAGNGSGFLRDLLSGARRMFSKGKKTTPKKTGNNPNHAPSGAPTTGPRAPRTQQPKAELKPKNPTSEVAPTPQPKPAAPEPTAAPPAAVPPMSVGKQLGHVGWSILANTGGQYAAYPFAVAKNTLNWTGSALGKVGWQSGRTALHRGGSYFKRIQDVMSGEAAYGNLAAANSSLAPAVKWINRAGNAAFHTGMWGGMAAGTYDAAHGIDSNTGIKVNNTTFYTNNGEYVTDKNGIPIVKEFDVEQRGIFGNILNQAVHGAHTFSSALLPGFIQSPVDWTFRKTAIEPITWGIKTGFEFTPWYKEPDEGFKTLTAMQEYVARTGDTNLDAFSENSNIPKENITSYLKPFLDRNGITADELPAGIQAEMIRNTIYNMQVAEATNPHFNVDDYLKPFGDAMQQEIRKLHAVNNDERVNLRALENEPQQSDNTANVAAQPPQQPAATATTEQPPQPQKPVATTTSTGNKSTPTTQPTGTKSNLMPWVLGGSALALLAGGSMMLGNRKSSQRKKKIAWVESQIRKGKMSYLEAEKYLNEDDE